MLYSEYQNTLRMNLYKEAYSSLCAMVTHIKDYDTFKAFVRLFKGVPVGRQDRRFRVWDVKYKNEDFSVIFDIRKNRAEAAEIEEQMSFIENDNGELVIR